MVKMRTIPDNTEFSKIVKETDKSWNCLEHTPTEWNEKKFKETKKCLDK